MSPTDEMLQPATEGDLRELGVQLRNELATRKDLNELRSATERALNELRIATERDFDRKLDLWGGALKTLIEEKAERTEQLLMAQFARWATAIDESVRSYLGVLDDKYRDLPPRVTRLETKVFPPKRATRRR